MNFVIWYIAVGTTLSLFLSYFILCCIWAVGRIFTETENR